MDYVSLNQCISEGVTPGKPVLEVSHRDGNNIVDFVRAAGRGPRADCGGRELRSGSSPVRRDRDLTCSLQCLREFRQRQRTECQPEGVGGCGVTQKVSAVDTRMPSLGACCRSRAQLRRFFSSWVTNR
jgi:hypothetical protein